MRKSFFPRTKAILLAVLIVILDQVTKSIARNYLSVYETLQVFPGFDLVLRFNSGAAFSFLSDASGWQRWLFVGIAIFISSFIVYWLGKPSEHSLEPLGLSCILGGAVGNLMDRIIEGRVTDFILLYYQQWSWPAFNIADTFISIGVGLLLFSWIRIKPKKLMGG